MDNEQHNNTPADPGVLDARNHENFHTPSVSQSEQSGKNNNDLFGFPAGVMLHG